MAKKNGRNAGLLGLFTSGKFANLQDTSTMDEVVRYIILNVAFLAGIFLLVGFGVSVFAEGNIFRSFFDFFVAVLGT
jgi:hypothetical protein